MSAAITPPRPWTWALDPEEIDVDGGGEAVLRDADGVEFLRAVVENADDRALLDFIVAAVNEVSHWRKFGVHASGEPEAAYPLPLRYVPLSAEEAAAQEGGA